MDGAIREVCRELALEVEVLRDGTLLAERPQPSRWESLMPRPKRIRWTISGSPDDLTVTCDPSWSARTLFGFLAACGVLALLIGGSFWVQGQDWYRRSDVSATVAAGVFLGSLGGWTWLFFVLGSLGGGRLSFRLWEPIRQAVEEEGTDCCLEPQGNLVGNRWLWAVLSYAGAFLLIVSPVVVPGLGEILRGTTVPGLLLIVAAALGIGLLAGVVLLAQRVESGLRADALLFGFITSCVVLLWLLLALPWYMVGRDLLLLFRRAPLWAGALLAGQLGAFCLLLYGLRLAILALHNLRRFQNPATRSGSYAGAVRGGAPLRATRWVFGTAWVLMSAWILTGLVLILGPVVDSELPASTRIVWGLYAAVPWLAWFLSVGQWIYARRRGRQEMDRARHKAEDSRHSVIGEIWRELLAEVPKVQPRLVIEESPAVYAHADFLGVWSSRPVVVLSRGAGRRLDPEELRGLLSHELAHHLLGHVRKAHWMRLLGRFTFVGDGFVLALQNSFGYEHEADEAATAELGLDRRVLGRALTKIRQVNAVLRMRARLQQSGLNADSVATRDDEEPPWNAFRFLLDQYFGWHQVSSKYYYWHPLPEERERP